MKQSRINHIYPEVLADKYANWMLMEITRIAKQARTEGDYELAEIEKTLAKAMAGTVVWWRKVTDDEQLADEEAKRFQDR